MYSSEFHTDLKIQKNIGVMNYNVTFLTDLGNVDFAFYYRYVSPFVSDKGLI